MGSRAAGAGHRVNSNDEGVRVDESTFERVLLLILNTKVTGSIKVTILNNLLRDHAQQERLKPLSKNNPADADNGVFAHFYHGVDPSLPPKS